MHTNGGICPFPSKLLCLILSKHFVEEPLCVPEKLWYRKMLPISGEGSRFSVQIVLSLSTESFCRGSLLCFKRLRYRKLLRIRDGDIVTIFRHKFCLAVPKNFVRDPFCVSEIFEYRKYLWTRGGTSRFFVQIVLSHSTETFCRKTFRCSRKILVSKNVSYKRGGGSRFSVQIVLSQTTDSFRRVTPPCFRKFSVHREIICPRAEYHYLI